MSPNRLHDNQKPRACCLKRVPAPHAVTRMAMREASITSTTSNNSEGDASWQITEAADTVSNRSPALRSAAETAINPAAIIAAVSAATTASIIMTMAIKTMEAGVAAKAAVTDRNTASPGRVITGSEGGSREDRKALPAGVNLPGRLMGLRTMIMTPARIMAEAPASPTAIAIRITAAAMAARPAGPPPIMDLPQTMAPRPAMGAAVLPALPVMAAAWDRNPPETTADRAEALIAPRCTATAGPPVLPMDRAWATDRITTMRMKTTIKAAIQAAAHTITKTMMIIKIRPMAVIIALRGQTASPAAAGPAAISTKI